MFSMKSDLLSDALRGGRAPKKERENKKLLFLKEFILTWLPVLRDKIGCFHIMQESTRRSEKRQDVGEVGEADFRPCRRALSAVARSNGRIFSCRGSNRLASG